MWILLITQNYIKTPKTIKMNQVKWKQAKTKYEFMESTS